MFGQGQHSTRTVSIYRRSVAFDFLLFFLVATETNSVSKGLCKFTSCFHQYDDGFILFMYHTVTHGQSTIAEQVSIFKFSLLTLPLSLSSSLFLSCASSLQRDKLLMTYVCAFVYIAKKNNNHLEEKGRCDTHLLIR